MSLRSKIDDMLEYYIGYNKLPKRLFIPMKYKKLLGDKFGMCFNIAYHSSGFKIPITFVNSIFSVSDFNVHEDIFIV